MLTGAEPRAGRIRLLERVREGRVALPLLVMAPVPIAVVLAVTARPAYPADACFYGAPRSSLLATDAYLALMTPLAMFALAVVAVVALPIRGRWRIVAPGILVWAVAALASPDLARPVIVYGGNLLVFGWIFVVPLIVIVVVAARESSWVRAIGWFELLVLLPILIGLAGVLAQPKCFAGDPPAPLR